MDPETTAVQLGPCLLAHLDPGVAHQYTIMSIQNSSISQKYTIIGVLNRNRLSRISQKYTINGATQRVQEGY